MTVSKSQDQRNMCWVREIDPVDTAVATDLVGGAPSAPRGLMHCGSRWCATFCMRGQGAWVSRSFGQIQIWPGCVLAICCGRAF